METTKKPIAKDPRLNIAFPVYGKVDVPFIQCIMAARDALPIIGNIDILPGDSLVSRARNNLVGRFLEGFDGFNEKQEPVTVLFDWLLFIDSDLVFDPKTIVRLYELGKKKGPGVYCGIYPIKQLKPKIVFNNLPGHVPDKDGLVQVREAGTGFMLIHREVFEKMREHYRDEIEFIADSGNEEMRKGWDFFSVGVRLDKTLNRKRYLSEDWYFCQRWREMGGEIWLDTGIQCGHIGTFTFPGNPKDIIEAADVHRRSMESKAGAIQTVKVKTVRTQAPESVPVAATD